MPAADWEIARVGARLGAIDGVLDGPRGEIAARLQAALSSVAVIRGNEAPAAPATDDARFIGRLLLGLLGRGWPTLSSPLVERALLEAVESAGCGLAVDPVASSGAVGWRLRPVDPNDGPAWAQTLLDGLLRGDPRLEIDGGVIASLRDSPEEQAFCENTLTPLLGQAIGWIEPQRPMATMARADMPGDEKIGSGRVDFALELPGQDDEHPIRLVIEYDGCQHKHAPQSKIDRNRDSLLGRHGWQTQRVHTWNEAADLAALKTWIEQNIDANPIPFQHIDSPRDPAADPMLREAMRLMLTPHAIARVQLALSRALLDGALRLDRPVWNLAVVEREVPCAELAMRDWLATLGHLCALYGVALGVRQIRLWVEREHLAEFAEAGMPPGDDGTRVDVQPVAALPPGASVDLAIDVAIGCHPTRRYPTDPLQNRGIVPRQTMILRTAQRQSGYRVDPWPEPRPIVDPLAHEASLVFFLQLLFRKAAFREGQLPIIERALRRQDVIGLLPTGAGKSITYQLPALLSPGLTLVIDPIKSLMQDQVENLHTAGIRDAIQINSDTPTQERARREWQFSQGEFRLVFISPERLQIQAFRDLLQQTIGGRPVAYLTIDEAHCVSEWGHDFRTAYLNLGRIAAHYCSRNGVRPPILALTGTASETVLRDVQRELAIDSDDAIIRPSAFDRPELHFEIVPISRPGKKSRLVRLLNLELPSKVGVAVDEFASGDHGGIVFCPHVDGKLGVWHVRTQLLNACRQFQDGKPGGDPLAEIERHRANVYSGRPPITLSMNDEDWSEQKARVQRSFKLNTLSLLVATTAFGMGIDKPNIRYTIHYCMPKSIEALAQETGRAGRDRNDSFCTVLFTDNPHPVTPNEKPVGDCLEQGISTEEAIERMNSIDKDGRDDAGVQMFLHSTGYRGMQPESLAVRDFLQCHLVPVLKSNEAAELTIADHHNIFSENVLAPYDGDHPDLQRVIYRLSTLGLIEDYTIDYKPSGNIYTLQIRALDEVTIMANLRAYVGRYKTADRFRQVQEQIEASTIQGGFACKAIDALIWFVYEEIERKRRRAMFNVRQLLRESKDGDDLARRLNESLSNYALTDKLFALTREEDETSVWQIAQSIDSAEAGDRVELQTRRALEDDPDHPGLLFLNGLGALATDKSIPIKPKEQSEDATGVDERARGVAAGALGSFDVGVSSLNVALQQNAALRDPHESQRIAATMIDHLYDIVPERADRVVLTLARDRRNRHVARRGFTRTADPEVKRACAAWLMHDLNDRLDAFLKG